MLCTTHEQTRHYRQDVAAHVPGAVTCPPELPGLCHWLRIPTPGGFVAAWDAAELGEHGLAVQAFELDRDEQVSYAGQIAWVWERAPRAGSRRGPPLPRRSLRQRLTDRTSEAAATAPPRAPQQQP